MNGEIVSFFHKSAPIKFSSNSTQRKMMSECNTSALSAASALVSRSKDPRLKRSVRSNLIQPNLPRNRNSKKQKLLTFPQKVRKSWVFRFQKGLPLDHHLDFLFANKYYIFLMKTTWNTPFHLERSSYRCSQLKNILISLYGFHTERHLLLSAEENSFLKFYPISSKEWNTQASLRSCIDRTLHGEEAGLYYHKLFQCDDEELFLKMGMSMNARDSIED